MVIQCCLHVHEVVEPLMSLEPYTTADVTSGSERLAGVGDEECATRDVSRQPCDCNPPYSPKLRRQGRLHTLAEQCSLGTKLASASRILAPCEVRRQTGICTLAFASTREDTKVKTSRTVMSAALAPAEAPCH